MYDATDAIIVTLVHEISQQPAILALPILTIAKICRYELDMAEWLRREAAEPGAYAAFCKARDEEHLRAWEAKQAAKRAQEAKERDEAAARGKEAAAE
jgi:hypothetical protein